MHQVKVHELRQQSKAELTAHLEELKAELISLRVAKVTIGASNQQSNIEERRSAMAPVLAEISQKQKAALREAYATRKYHALDLDPKTPNSQHT